MHNHERSLSYLRQNNPQMSPAQVAFLLDLATGQGNLHDHLTPAQRRRVRHKTGGSHRPVRAPQRLAAVADEAAGLNWSLGASALRTPSTLSRAAAREALLRARERAAPRRRRV